MITVKRSQGIFVRFMSRILGYTNQEYDHWAFLGILAGFYKIFFKEKLIQLLTSKLASLARQSSDESVQLNKATEYLHLAVENIKNEVSFKNQSMCMSGPVFFLIILL